MRDFVVTGSGGREATPGVDRARGGARLRRATRLAGTLLIAAGVLTLAWAIVVWRWQDPFTALYTHFQQQHLAAAYKKKSAAFRPRVHVATRGVDLASLRRQVALEATAYRDSLTTGGPIGRLKIGRIGLSMIVVQGTDEGSLEKGPGHYVGTELPGQGGLIYIAGHRTTYLAPFSDINDIRIGDYVTFEVPYGTFTYRVFRHYVVPADDLAVLVNHGREILRLQACHPRFFATHRYIVDARLVAFTPRGLRRSIVLPVARA
jgi:sortase A